MISSVVAHLQPESDAAVTAISQNPDIEMGARSGNRLPLVLETEDSSAAKALFHWINELPGVSHLDVTYVYFDSSVDAQKSSNKFATSSTRTWRE